MEELRANGLFRFQAPCLTPEWTRTDHGQTVFYTEQRCIPLQGQCHFNLDGEIRLDSRSVVDCATGLSQDLEELMVEGLLLQVSLPEVQNLYNILLDRVSSLHTDRCTSPPQTEPADCSPHAHFNSQGHDHQVQSASRVTHFTASLVYVYTVYICMYIYVLRMTLLV